MLIMSLLCFSKVTIAFFNQQIQQPSFPMFYNVPICRSLAGFYITPDGKIKPVAQASLPLEYYLHKSIPEHYRSLFYDQAEAWNNTVGNEIIRINGEIDQSVLDPEVNPYDQKNVIYLTNEEDHIRLLNVSDSDLMEEAKVFIPGLSRIVPSKTEFYQNALSFLPITDVDIMIREEVLTDIGFYKHRLLVNLRRLGIGGNFDSENIEVIRSTIFDYIANMSNEDIKALLIEDLEVEKKELVEASKNAENNQDILHGALYEIEQKIETFQNMTDGQIGEVRNTLSNTLLSVDMDLMQSQSSVMLQNTIRHEMGHGLGLEEYILPRGHPMRYQNVMRPHVVEAYSQITILKEIDPFAVYGVFCLYKEYPNITDSVLNAIL